MLNARFLQKRTLNFKHYWKLLQNYISDYKNRYVINGLINIFEVKLLFWGYKKKVDNDLDNQLIIGRETLLRKLTRVIEKERTRERTHSPLPLLTILIYAINRIKPKKVSFNPRVLDTYAGFFLLWMYSNYYY